MLTSTLRSRLVGLPNKRFVRSRVFSTAPVHRLPFQRLPFNVERAFQGELGLNWTPEILTVEGIAKAFIYCSHTDCDNAASLARARASLTEKDAHNCNLLFTSDHLKSLPKLGFNIWMLQAGTAHKIVQYHQHQALLRAGILIPPQRASHSDSPEQESPEDFEACLRAAGLVGGKFEVWPRSTDAFWEQCIQVLSRSA